MLAEGDSTEDKLIHSIVGEAVKAVFARYADLSSYDEISLQFKGGITLQVGDDVPTAVMLENYTHIKGLHKPPPTSPKPSTSIRKSPLLWSLLANLSLNRCTSTTA